MEKETKVAAVSMKNITKTFGSVIANDKVNLDIYKGEILSLLGENGSGKTTLMNMLSGIYFRMRDRSLLTVRKRSSNPPRMRYGWELVWCISILS